MIDELRQRYLPRFKEVANARLGAVLAALAGTEAAGAETARRELHSLAGEAGVLGFSALARKAREIEDTALHWGATGDVAARLACARAVRELVRQLGALSVTPATASSDTRARTRVLVVDDSEIVVAQVCAALEDAGFEAASADDLAGLEKLMAERRPELVLLDANIPEVSLESLCARARVEVGPARPLVCILSGSSEKALAQRARDVGADAYISKDVGAAGVAAEVKKLLAARPTARGANDAHGA